MMRGRLPLDKETESRKRAFAGAWLALSKGISHKDAAVLAGSSPWRVTETYLVLKRATQEEIDDLEAGRIALRAVTKAIRSRTSAEARKSMRKPPPNRESKLSEIEFRKKSFAGARQAIADGLTHNEAAALQGVTRRAVSDAYVILQNGTEDEIAKAERGEIAMSTLIDRVRATVSPEIRKQKRKAGRFGVESRMHRDAEIAIWNNVRDALNAIASLPKPGDVIPIIKKHRMREQRVNENLITAFAWITEFSDAWTR